MKRGVVFLWLLGTAFFAQSQSLLRYYTQTHIGFAMGVGHANYIVNNHVQPPVTEPWSFDISSINGIEIKKHRIGVGVGANVWKKRALVPLFLRYTLMFLDKKVTPQLYIDGGYAFGKYNGGGLIGDEKGSFLFRPGFGLQARLSPKLFFVTHVFYKQQTLRARYYSYDLVNPVPISEQKGTGYFVLHHFLGVDVGIKL